MSKRTPRFLVRRARTSPRRRRSATVEGLPGGGARSAIAIALARGLAGAPAMAAEWAKVRIATDGAYPPWSWIDASGQLIGFEIDLADDLCARMAVECEFVTQDWQAILDALLAGRCDVVMAGMPVTAERREIIRFSDSYAALPAYFAVLRESDLAGFRSAVPRANLDAIDPAEQAMIDHMKAHFAGRSVGVQVATGAAAFLAAHFADEAEIRKYDTQEHLVGDLQAGRIDLALASVAQWDPIMASDEGAALELIGPALTGGPFGAGIAAGMRTEDTDLVAMFNRAIAAARADGTITRLAQEWFGFDVSS